MREGVYVAAIWDEGMLGFVAAVESAEAQGPGALQGARLRTAPGTPFLTSQTDQISLENNGRPLFYLIFQLENFYFQIFNSCSLHEYKNLKSKEPLDYTHQSSFSEIRDSSNV